MRPRTTTALLILCLAAAPGGCGESDDVLLADGRSVPFTTWHGKWLAINYWAEWCAPCRKEIPELNRLHADGAEIGLAVLGVNYDGLTGDKLAALAAEMDIEFPVLVADPRLRWEAEQPVVLPTTLIIDPEGMLRSTLVGPQHYEDVLRATGLGARAVPAPRPTSEMEVEPEAP